MVSNKTNSVMDPVLHTLLRKEEKGFYAPGIHAAKSGWLRAHINSLPLEVNFDVWTISAYRSRTCGNVS